MFPRTRFLDMGDSKLDTPEKLVAAHCTAGKFLCAAAFTQTLQQHGESETTSGDARTTSGKAAIGAESNPEDCREVQPQVGSGHHATTGHRVGQVLGGQVVRDPRDQSEQGLASDLVDQRHVKGPLTVAPMFVLEESETDRGLAEHPDVGANGAVVDGASSAPQTERPADVRSVA